MSSEPVQVYEGDGVDHGLIDRRRFIVFYDPTGLDKMRHWCSHAENREFKSLNAADACLMSFSVAATVVSVTNQALSGSNREANCQMAEVRP